MRNLANYIDHTLLKADASLYEVRRLCEEAKEYRFASVCVNPIYIEFCKESLSCSDVKVCTVIGFPLGSSLVSVKRFETEEALSLGAQEIDMVINLTNVKNKNYDAVCEEISSIQDSIAGRAVLKVIVETSLLSSAEKIKLAEICRDLNVDFIKTSTGFSTGGATVEDLELISSVTKGKIGIKASGGIRDFETALKMLEAGATRIGASASVNIIKGQK